MTRIEHLFSMKLKLNSNSSLGTHMYSVIQLTEEAVKLLDFGTLKLVAPRSGKPELISNAN